MTALYLTPDEISALSHVLNVADGLDLVSGPDAVAVLRKVQAAHDSAPATMDVARLVEAIFASLGRADTAHVPVRLIVGGVAYPVVDVWLEPRQERGSAAICIGEDPR